jgi:CxxC motif-containing protein
MIKLKKIVKTNNRITCEAFIEDCDLPLNLVFDISRKDFEKYSLPRGYEWCDSHINHAKRYFTSLIGINEVPHEHTIMWY